MNPTFPDLTLPPHQTRAQWRRLDADNIPYEQLLELQERIGNVNTGLSEENITSCLKTRTVTSGDLKDEKIFNETCIVCQDEYKDNDTIGTYLKCGHDVNDEEIFNEACIVCQDEYKDNDMIGTLKCGHEYHRDCIKKWLSLKNVCPMCKGPALSTTTS